MITPTGTAAVGQGYTLTCSVSGTDSLSPTSTTYRWYNGSSETGSPIGTNSSTYTFSSLRPYHAGQYTCEVTVASPFLNADLSQSMMQSITLQSKSCHINALYAPLFCTLHPAQSGEGAYFRICN